MLCEACKLGRDDDAAEAFGSVPSRSRQGPFGYQDTPTLAPSFLLIRYMDISI